MQTGPLVECPDPGLLGGTPTSSSPGEPSRRCSLWSERGDPLACPPAALYISACFSPTGFPFPVALATLTRSAATQGQRGHGTRVAIDSSAGQSCEDGPDLTWSAWRPRGTCVLAEPGQTGGASGGEAPGCLQRVMMRRATKRSTPEPPPHPAQAPPSAGAAGTWPWGGKQAQRSPCRP